MASLRIIGRRIGKGLLVALLVLFIAGTLYEPVAQRRDRERFIQIGKSIDVGGRALNLHCEGEGEPTVIFDTFSHSSGYSWSAVQAEVTRFSRACWYDRAGYGWSDTGPLGQTAEDVVKDLHALLTAARVPSPYVIVGNGDVSLQVRVYSRLYPAHLAGAVLVDGNDVEDPPATPEEHQPLLARHVGAAFPYIRKGFCFSLPVMSRIGLFRWSAARPSGGGYGLSPSQERKAAHLSDNPRAYAATASSLCAQERSREQARLTKSLDDRPLVILTSDNSQDADADAYWASVVQPKLAALSRRGQRRVVAPDENQMLLAIVAAVRDVVDQVRSNRP